MAMVRYALKALVTGNGRDASHRVMRGVVVFGAGKGGVGTSTLTALVAMAAARGGASVLLVDSDETVGSLHLQLGFNTDVPGLGTLRGGSVAPEGLLLEVEPGLTLFPGGGGGVASTLAVAGSERRSLMRRVAALYERYDLVLVDGGSRLDSVVASCAAGAGRLMTLTLPDRIAEAGAYALLKAIHGRFSTLPAEVLVNRASEAEARAAHVMVDSAATSFLGIGIPFAGAIPDDATSLASAAGAGTLASLPASAPVWAAAAGLADRLLREEYTAATPVLRFPSRD
jgi:MinD-like ATPase involved in chromosome partitioning or flagellar assembly